MPTVFSIADVKAAALLTVSDYDAALPGWVATLESQLEQFTGLTLASREVTVRVSGRWHRVLILPGRPVSEVSVVRIWEGEEFADGDDLTGVNFMGQNADYDGATPTALTLGVGYGVDFNKHWGTRDYSFSGKVERNGRVWPGAVQRKRGRLGVKRVRGQNNIEVTYKFGFVDAADIPPAFLTAVAAGVQAYIQRIPSGGMIETSNSLDGASVGRQLDSGGSEAGGGLYLPELGSVRAALAPYCVPRIF
jgi:hypothetical protein